MRIKPFSTRTHDNPDRDITLTRDEKSRANEWARILTGLPHEALLPMLTALSRYAIYLEQDAAAWSADGALDDYRIEQHQNTILAYNAVRWANARI